MRRGCGSARGPPSTGAACPGRSDGSGGRRITGHGEALGSPPFRLRRATAPGKALAYSPQPDTTASTANGPPAHAAQVIACTRDGSGLHRVPLRHRDAGIGRATPARSTTVGIASSKTPTKAERRAFILRHGILRYGVPLGMAVFAWVVSGAYSTTLEHLETRAGRLRLLLFLALATGEWVIGAGWVIGRLLWYLRQRSSHPESRSGS
jgi:hypothetical protein